MRKIDQFSVNQCRQLRYKGYSLGEICSMTALPKTTVYGYIKDIILSNEQKWKLKQKGRLELIKRNRLRKGKCIFGRNVLKPIAWSSDLIHIVAHFMFDGSIEKYGCLYYSKDDFQITHLKNLVEKLFNVKAQFRERNDGIKVLSFYYVELAEYMRKKAKELLSYLKNGASRKHRRIFLQAFFDDEGNIYFKNDKRRVRGYQKSLHMLEEIKNILSDFGIKSKIDKKYNEIEISGRKNLEKFAQEINFSSQIYINPDRSNTIWRRRIEKRKILDLAIKSYKK